MTCRIIKSATHWYDAPEEAQETYYCPTCIEVCRVQWCHCSDQVLPKICSRCMDRTGNVFPEHGSTQCKQCNDIPIPIPSKDITKVNGILHWKGAPFYVLGRFNKNGDEYVLASFFHLRVSKLEEELEELKGIVADLLQIIRDSHRFPANP